MIRTTAVEALARLGGAGNAEAVSALEENALHDNRSVRIACITSLLEHGGPDVRERLRQILPEGDEALLDIRRLTPEQVTQPDPREHLAHPDRPRDVPGLPPPL